MSLLRLALPVIAVLVLSSCGGGGGGPAAPDVADILVDPDSLDLAQQGSAQLRATVVDGDGRAVTGVPVTWASSDTTRVRVSSSGLVSARGRAGAASITVRADDVERRVPVVVRPLSSALRLAPRGSLLPQNGTLQLVATVTDAAGDTVPGAPVTFSTGGSPIASVSATGLLQSLGPSGTLVVAAQSGALTDTTTVTVTQVPTSLRASPASLRMAPGREARLTGVVLDAVGVPMSGFEFQYGTSDGGVATVGSTGRVASVAPGSAGIAVTAAGLTVNVPVLVVPRVSPEGVLDGAASLPGAPDPVVGAPPFAYGAAVADDGTILLVARSLWRGTRSARTFTELSPAGTALGFGVAFAPGGATAWVANRPQFALVEVDAVTGAELGRVDGLPNVDWFRVALSRDGTRLFASGDGRLAVIDPATRTLLRTVTTASEGLSLEPTAGGRVLVGGDGAIEEVDPETGARRTVTLVPVKNFALSADGATIYGVFETGSDVRVFDVATGRESEPIPTPFGAFGIALAPDGTRLVLSSGGAVLVVDIASRAVVANLGVGGSTLRTAFDPVTGVAVVTNTLSQVNFIR